MNPDRPATELDRLLMAMAEGELTPEGERRLAELLEHDPSARERYTEYVLLDCLLSWERYPAERSPIGRLPALGGDEPARPHWWATVSRRTTRLMAAAAAIALVATVGGLAWLRTRMPAPAPTVVAERTAAEGEDRPPSRRVSGGVAILTHAIDVEWEPGRPAPGVDTVLDPGPLEFRSGLIGLSFYSGATVLVEGPAAIDLKASDHAVCRRGKLRAHVPPQARGFRVDSPAAELVDLGTEFVMAVDADRGSEVHVVDGKVEVHGGARTPEPKRELTEGQSVRIAPDGGVVAIASDPRAFPTFQDVELRDAAEARRRLDQWVEDSRRWQSDRRVVASFPFAFQGQPGGMPSLADAGPRHLPDGAIVGCGRAEGRWPGKGALEFKRPGDRVRISVPGEFESLTMMAWVRVDALQSLSALLLTDGFDAGEVHWQISVDGQMCLGVHEETESPIWDNYLSPPVFHPARYGRWTHLAVVYDAPRGQIIHYVDGRAVSHHPIVELVRIRIGQAELGNWGAPRTGDLTPVRNLTGRMDEFLILDSPLGPREISAAYERGRPGS